MKLKMVFIFLLAAVLLTACRKVTPPSDVKAPQWAGYTFDDSDRGVKFSISYPENWTLSEERGWDGDETRDASPDTGISFSFGSDERVSVAAMLFTPYEFGAGDYVTEEFETEAGLKGTKYTDLTGDRISVIYAYSGREDLPWYFASVNMSETTYDSNKDDIEKAAKSFKLD
ncbi:hypothetical protein [Anaerolentibacter hominis]|uniref:hypothetical protein n=1 Tax=Anaerolentibacter hominis TaxID=3079009 RepID=UPI0031B84533